MEAVKLDDMSATIGAKDNTMIHSVVNKLIRIKCEMYRCPSVLFEDKKGCYRISLIWNEEVAINYQTDINPLIDMIQDRFADFSFATFVKDGVMCTAFSMDLIKEAHIHMVPHMTKRKRNTNGVIADETLLRLPRLADAIAHSDVPYDFSGSGKKRKTKKKNRSS